MTKEKTSLKSLLVERCPECGGSSVVHDPANSEIVCTSCGFVVARKLVDRGPEWRAFTPEQYTKRVRVGAPYTFAIHDKGLTTSIKRRDIHGYPSEKKAQLYRLSQWQRRIRLSSCVERNLASSLSEMHRIADSLKLPRNVLETAAVMYRKAINKRLTRGRSLQGIVVAALYLACRQCKLLRTIEELSQASGVNKVEVARYYRFLVKKFGYSVPPQKASKYITNFCSKLDLSGEKEEVAYDILQAAKELKLTSGRRAKSIAAAACYIASKISIDYRTQREIAEVAQITEVTLRNRYKELMKKIWIVVSL